MNFLEKIVYVLQAKMETPKPYGWFHLMWICLVIVSIYILYKSRKSNNDKQLKIVLGVYGITALVLEILKQVIWSFNYDMLTGIVTWDYQWYAAPFQLCTTPIYVSIICLFLKNGKFKNSLLSYITFVTILGSFFTIIMPDSCFTKDILINIHTMWLHCGSFVVSVYLVLGGAVKIHKQNLIDAFKVFLGFVLIAEILNIGIYNMGILKGETFNMFYISPYFISALPVFNIIQEKVPYIIYLLIYITSILIGSLIVFSIFIFFKREKNKKINKKIKKVLQKKINVV